MSRIAPRLPPLLQNSRTQLSTFGICVDADTKQIGYAISGMNQLSGQTMLKSTRNYSSADISHSIASLGLRTRAGSGKLVRLTGFRPDAAPHGPAAAGALANKMALRDRRRSFTSMHLRGMASSRGYATSGPSPIGSSSGTAPLTTSSDPTATVSSSTPPPTPEPEPTTVSGRLKALFTKYGKHAIGVYLLLSGVDLTISYLLVHLVGAERIEGVKDMVVEAVGWYIPGWSTDGDEVVDAAGGRETGSTVGSSSAPTSSASDATSPAPIKKKPSSISGSALFWAEFALAYGIHKTLFLPVRVGLTAAWTPKLVGWLTRRGWVGKGGVSRAALHGKEVSLEKVKDVQEKVKAVQGRAQERVKVAKEKVKEMRRKE